MTSNLGSEEIRAASPKLHKLVAKTEDLHAQYLKGIGQFNRQLYPVLKESLKRDEFLGRINQTVIFLPFNDQEVRNESHPDI
jgi:ATP-dependent Clp protease ATP-binding subunit ClpB